MDKLATTGEAKDLIKEIFSEMLKNADFNKVLVDCVERVTEKKLKTIKEVQERQDAKIFHLEQALEKKDKEINEMKCSMEKLDSLNETLQANLNSLEQYSRRNCLRVFGLTESPNENTTAMICSLAQQKLGVELKTTDIDRSHRVGPAAKDGKTRGIIVKFMSYTSRDLVIRNRRKLKGTGIVIKEDLTWENQKLLRATLDLPSVSSAWTKDGVIFALLKKDGNEIVQRVKCADDLKKL